MSMAQPLASNREAEVLRLEKIARGIRIEVIKMLLEAGSGHPGGSLSATDIIVCLFFHKMRHKPEDPFWPERDRFVLSKGHAVPALYAVLAEAGYIPKEELKNLRKLGSPLQGHPDKRMLPILEAGTGSLGQGLAMAQGMAMAGKINKASNRVYCLIGDGESQEGQIWETAMSAPKFQLNNLIAFLDYNKGQIDGQVCDVMPIEPVIDKWTSFNWRVFEINGNSIEAILGVLDDIEEPTKKPTMIISHTIKGKGVSFMEGKPHWHGVAPTAEEAQRAIEELGRTSV